MKRYVQPKFIAVMAAYGGIAATAVNFGGNESGVSDLMQQ